MDLQTVSSSMLSNLGDSLPSLGSLLTNKSAGSFLLTAYFNNALFDSTGYGY